MRSQACSFTRLLACALILIPVAAWSEASKPGFHNESEAGVVITGGNASSESLLFKELATQRWERDAIRFDGRYLRTSSRGLESAKNWLLGGRYERALSEALGIYAGQSLESDEFAGFLQRYNSDVGGQYAIVREEALRVLVEGGYRYVIENRRAGQVNQSLLRLFGEATRDWTRAFSTRASLEYLPNLTIESDYQLNLDLSASAAINEIFALKTGYTLKYRRIPVAPAVERSDTQFTTSIVAKF